MANFFEQQAQARSITTRLVGLYVLAVACICIAIGTAVSLLLRSESLNTPNNYTAEAIGAGFALLVIGIGTLIRIRQLGGSGAEVATLLGGTLVDPSTQDLLERRLLNVVEEMAIASGIPVPRVYILKHESGINAFAAGMKPGEAVVGVTQGCLEQLSRDELQGVVAHEFSHVFNGDMRLNLRLMGVLGGILALTTVGRLLLDLRLRSRSSSSKKNDGAGALVLLGFAFVVVGYIGVFFARLIKAAVSRQREYLADSSAVQYTRNPDGIGSALMKIERLADRSQVKSAYAEEASHMFFGSVASFSSLFATHPEISDRVNRISPALLKSGPKPSLGSSIVGAAQSTATSTSESMDRRDRNSGFNLNEKSGLAAASLLSVVTPRQSSPRSQSEAAAQRSQTIMHSVGTPTLDDLTHAKEKLASIPFAVRDQLNTTIGASAGVLALLLQNESGSSAQSAIIRDCFDEQTLEYTQMMYREMGESLHRDRLMILDLAVPALRLLDEDEQRKLLLCCRDLVHADGRYDLFEYVALTILDHQFFSAKKRHQPRPRLSGPRTTNDLSTVLSAIAHAGADDQTKAKAAFDAGVEAIRSKNSYPLTFRTIDECRLQAIADAVDRLSFLEPGSQKMVVDACIRTVVHDCVVNQDESELLKAICTVLEAPLPATAV